MFNGNDVGEWIGATSDSLFNFHPSARPVPLEIFSEGVVRMESIQTLITQHAKNEEHILVYVPTKENIEEAFEILISCLHAEPRELTIQQQEAFEAAVCKISDLKLQLVLTVGVAFLHEGLKNDDCEVIIRLFEAGLIRLCMLSSGMCWSVSLSAPLVVLIDTDLFDYYGPNYPITDLLRMTGQAGRQSIDSVGKVLILCPQGKKSCYNIFLNEVLPLESNLHHCLPDTLNARVVAGIIKNIRDGVNYLAETFLCRRLHKNPSYYDFNGVSDEEVGNHLLSLFQWPINKLITSGMVLHHGGDAIFPSNLGSIASDCYIKCKTVEVFSTLTQGSYHMREILQILLSASEYDELPIRRIEEEEEEIRQLTTKERFPHSNMRVTDPHAKANTLLQAHFSRLPITSVTLAADRSEVVLLLEKLLI